MTTPADLSPVEPGRASYPDAPWRMVGSLWLTVFRLSHDVDAQRPRGTYGAAFVSYEEGSPLTYSEVLVARAMPRRAGRGPEITITDIWVDSPASVAGGRALWAIPKGLCDLDLDTSHRGPLTRSEWSASFGRRPIASASFTDVSGAAPRLPFRATTWQPGLPEGGGAKHAVLHGTSKALPARARWDFAADGPLDFMRGARPLASLRMAAFRMSFG